MDKNKCPISPSDAISFLGFYKEVFEFGDKKSHKVGFSKCGSLLNIPLVSEQPRKAPFSRVFWMIIVKVLLVLENNPYRITQRYCVTDNTLCRNRVILNCMS